MGLPTFKTLDQFPADCRHRIEMGGWTEDLTLARCHFPVGPRNTWSNLAYWLAAAFVLWRHPGGVAWLIALGLVTLGFGSFCYHGFKTRWGNNLDWLGMYWALGGCFQHAVAGDSISASYGFLIAGAAMGAMMAFDKGSHFDALVGVGALLVGIATVGGGPFVHGYFRIALGAMALGYLAWQGDKKGYLGLWGHAIWHVLTAVGLAALFLSRHP